MSKCLVLGLLCLLISSKGERALAQSAAINLDDRESLEFAANDDRVAAMLRAKELLERTDPETQPIRWMRALWFYLEVNEYRSDYDVPADFANVSIPNIKQALEKAIRIAEHENLIDDLYDLKGMLEGERAKEQQNQTTKEPKDIKADFEARIQEARQSGFKRWESHFMLQYAFYLRYQGELDASLKMLLAANELMKEDPAATELQRMLIKTDVALALAFHDQPDKSEIMQQEIADYCSRVTLHEYCLINSFNYAKLLVDQDDPQKIARAGTLLTDAMAVAISTKALWMQGNIHSALAIYHNKTKQFEQALHHADKGIEIFKKLGEELRLINCYKRGAVSLIGLRRFDEALEYLTLARNSSDAGAPFINELDELSYQAYRGLGNLKQALAHLEKHASDFKKLAADREKSDYSRLMVRMGLQIEEEKNKVLSKDNELKSQKLHETERLRYFTMGVLGLSVLVILSLSIAIFRSREVKASRLKTQRILDNIEECILTINLHMEVESEYSRYLNVLLGIPDDLKGRDALSMLLEKTSLGLEERSMIQESLHASIGEDALQWSLNQHNLPQELIYPEAPSPKVVAVQWLPLFDKNERVQSILIGLTNVTERRRLEAEVLLERQRSDRQTRIISELANADLDRVAKVLDQAQALLTALPGPEASDQRAAILRDLHTIKGVARTLGLKELSSESHTLEDQLQNFADKSSSPPGENFQESLRAYKAVLEHIFVGRRSTPHLSTQRNLAHVVNGVVPDLIHQLRNAGLDLQGLVIIDRVMSWTPKLLDAIEPILLHALTNAADHGFILPQSKGQITASPQFQIQAKPCPEGIELLIRDNGVGLDFKKLEALAGKIGFHPEPGRSIADVLFMEGSSTADLVTQTSGRGIGMSAIRSICQRWGGSVSIVANPDGPGAQLVAILSTRLKENFES